MLVLCQNLHNLNVWLTYFSGHRPPPLPSENSRPYCSPQSVVYWNRRWLLMLSAQWTDSVHARRHYVASYPAVSNRYPQSSIVACLSASAPCWPADFSTCRARIFSTVNDFGFWLWLGTNEVYKNGSEKLEDAFSKAKIIFFWLLNLTAFWCWRNNNSWAY